METAGELKRTTTGGMRPVRAAILRLVGDEQRGPSVELRLGLANLLAASCCSVTYNKMDRKLVVELQVDDMVLVMAPALLHGAFVYEPKLRPSALCPALMFDGQ
jgi:hypothetical protein